MLQDNWIALERAIESEPLTVTPDVLLEEVIELMNQNWSNSCQLAREEKIAKTKSVASVDASCVLAVVNSQIMGILTERDLVRLISEGRNLKNITVEEVMSKNVITLTSTGSSDIFAVLNLFHRYQIHHVPIIDRNERFLGLVTQASLHRALQSVELLKFRTVKEVMSRAIHALPSASVLEVTQLMTDYRVSCIPIVETEKSFKPIGIITKRDIVQFRLLELNLSRIQAQTVMSTPLFLVRPEESLWAVQHQMRQRRIRRLVVADGEGKLLGIISQRGLLQAIDGIELQGFCKIFQSGVRCSERERIEFLRRQNSHLITRVEQQAFQLQERSRREQLVAKIALKVRQSLDWESILNKIVADIRKLIEADRVLFYRFEDDFSGIVTHEAVSDPRWSILHRVVRDSCFESSWLDLYRQGHIFAVADIERSPLSPCHKEFLASFQVKANVAIPLLLRAEDTSTDILWGLLIVHQCSNIRHWQESELELLQLLATHIAIAIQQSKLYQQVQKEITQRRQTEATLQKRETQLKTALDVTAMGTWSWNILTNEVILSEHSRFIMGFAEDEFSKTLKAIVERIHPEDRDLFEEKATTAIEEGRLYEIEIRIILPNSIHRWLTAKGHVFLNSQKQPTQMIGVVADITEKKQLEETYLRQQRIESLGSLASGVAHDLNNILTPIMMSVQLLPETLSHIDSRSQKLLKLLENNVKRGSALVKQVLSFARGIEREGRDVQVKHLIADIKQVAIETFPKSIDIQTDVSPDLWAIFGNATQIHQILLNLVINARDAMAEGGFLSISATNIKIDEEYVREHSQAKVGSYIVISVTDTGMGISPENIERIFEPFFSTKKNEGGTGLGLATVTSIVQNHDGFIDTISKVGQGTQFNVFLPAVEVAKTDSVESLTIPRGKGELILVVDDEATICEITKASLENYNYRAVVANNGIEAIASYVQYQPEIAVVLMNIVMPAMNGVTAIRTLQKIDPQIKIIVVTGSDLNYETLRDRQLNISSFLAKPYSTHALLKTVREAIDRVKT